MEYSGEKNLKTMKLAHNYNSYLIKEVCSKCNGKNVVLDFGSRDGYFANMISSKINIEVQCLEPSDNMLKYYKKTFIPI